MSAEILLGRVRGRNPKKQMLGSFEPNACDAIACWEHDFVVSDCAGFYYRLVYLGPWEFTPNVGEVHRADDKGSAIAFVRRCLEPPECTPLKLVWEPIDDRREAYEKLVNP